MPQADASWWGDEDEFLGDMQARIQAGGEGANEAKGLLAAFTRRKQMGANPFAPQAPQQAPEAPQAPQGHGQAIAVPFATGGKPLSLALYANQTSAAQGRHLQGMIDATTSAWQDENDSRVAQAREQARMDHETQLEAMRNEAMLQRLQKELEDRERERRARNGGLLRRINGGGWEVV